MTPNGDAYSTPGYLVNVNDYLPSPPGIGLPYTGTDLQQYIWECPRDSKVSKFTELSSISTTLYQSGDKLRFKTEAYGQSWDEDYVGPALATSDDR